MKRKALDTCVFVLHIQKCLFVTSMRPPLASYSDQVYVVSTSSRGLGLEFTRQLLDRTKANVVALTRADVASPSPILSALLNNYSSRLRLVKIDLEDQASVEEAARTIRATTDRVDLLLNVAGLLGDGKTDPGPERSLQRLDRDWLRRSMEINVFGHVMLTQQLLPLMKTNSAGPVSSVPKVVNLSARVGSIGDNGLGGWYSYRMSKAALNMFTKTLAVEMKRVGGVALSLHPGTVATDLSSPFKNVPVDEVRLFSPPHAVALMLDVVWGAGPEKSGSFLAYDGSEIPW